MPLSLVLVDDHRMVRQGLHAILAAEKDFQVVAQSATGADGLDLVERHRPDVLVLDMMMPGLSGLDVTREVVRRFPRTHVVILSMHAEVPYVAEAFRVGANGYVLKEDGPPELIKAIREAAEGHRFLSPAISDEALRNYSERAKTAAGEPDPVQSLSLREREVFQLTAEGLSGTEIADRLFISSRTVESHRASILRKLGVRNHKELIRFAVRRGILPESP